MKTQIKMYAHTSRENNYYLSLGIDFASKEAKNNFQYALYEVEFDVEVDLNTGDTEIIAVDGHKLLPK
jgi:hypothetical protein